MRLTSRPPFKFNLSRHRVVLREPHQTVHILAVGDPSWSHALAKLSDSALLQEQIIKWENKIVVARLKLKINGIPTIAYLKQHKLLSLGQRIISLVYPSAAMRSLRAAAILLGKGFVTAPPLAVMEYRSLGVLVKSIYIAEELTGAQSVESYWLNQLRTFRGETRYRIRYAYLTQLARLLCSLHRNGIYHNDLKSANILALPDPQARFGLIDLQGLRSCCFISWRRRIKNLAQLNRTLGVHLTRAERLAFLNEYANGLSLTHRAKLRLIRKVIIQTEKQRIRELNRHPHTEKPFDALFTEDPSLSLSVGASLAHGQLPREFHPAP